MSNVHLLQSTVATAFYGNFRQLREVQDAAIEPILKGRNIVLTSGTGSGKTEAVMAPLVSKYWRQAALSQTLFLLYIVPTKALVNDLEKRLYPILISLGLRLGVRHGDRDDITNKPTPHVLLTTPESLEVLLLGKQYVLRSIRAVVIDEVHLLYNTQRGLQLSILLSRLKKELPNGFQWAALSATIGNLSSIRDFLFDDNENVTFLAYPSNRAIDAHIMYVTNPEGLLALLHKLIYGRSTKLLIFANSRRECEKLAGLIQNDDLVRSCVFTHYSSLSPEVRIDTEKKFSSMSTAICIATSTLELGIDIGDIDAVILWGVPSGIESFLQRIGRGNRRSNKTNVICIVPDDSSTIAIDSLRFAAFIDAASKGELPVQGPFELFGAIGQQCLSIIASEGGGYTKVTDLCMLMEHKPYLSREIVDNILSELASKGFLQWHGFKKRYGADEELYKLIDMKMIYGNFGAGSQAVDIFDESRHLGEVPAANLLRVRERTCVRFAGKCWRVKKISFSGIYLDPSSPASDAIDFTYGGRNTPLDPHNIDRVWMLIHSENIFFDIFAKDVQLEIESFRDQFHRICSENTIPFLRNYEGIRYFTFAGYLVNRAIGLYTRNIGFKADDFSLQVSSPVDWATIPSRPSDYENIFPLLIEDSSDQSIYQKCLPLDLQIRENVQYWLKDTYFSNILVRLSKSETIEIMDVHGV